MADLRIAPSLPVARTNGSTIPQKKTVSLAEIEKRTARAAKIEQIFSGIKPGQRLANANQYLIILQDMLNQASQDYKILHTPQIQYTQDQDIEVNNSKNPFAKGGTKRGVRSTNPVQKEQEALDRQIAILRKIRTIAETAQIFPSAPQKPAASAARQFPWEGKLRKGETPLHWAVRNHDHRTACGVRYQIRQNRLANICEYFAASVKDKKVVEILKKPGFLPKLLSAVELLHFTSYIPLDSKELQEFFKENPDIAKVIQDPNFSKLFKDPQAHFVLNGLDVLSDLDSKQISPVEEAILQKDPQMTHILLFSHLLANPQLHKIFWSRVHELKARMEALRKVDPNTLSEASRAAYLGDKSQLEFMTENELNSPDAKGLTPLHYALLGKQGEAIEYLLPQCHLYTLTPQGHSYLDYAILAGHGGALNVFQNLKLPFKLGKEEERFSYYVASGILNQQLSLSAKQKDPLALGQMDKTFGGLNAAWLGLHLMNRWIGTPSGGDPGWIGWGGTKLEGYAAYFNDALGLNRIFGSMPSQIAPFVHTGAFVNLFALPILSGIGNWAIGTPQWPGVIKLVNDYVTPVNPTYVAASYAMLRIAVAAKPVWDKMPLYYDNFKSRPKEVMKNLALDTFNIGTQVFMNMAELPALPTQRIPWSFFRNP